ncbi:MAG: hypothetical protein JO336_07295, partial [Acidobacteriia bacterium]|nr:hypothetical protein [Terriglobia bacterium]
ITSQAILLTEDDLPHYLAHCQKVVENWQPVGADEQDLVQTIADQQWRLHSIRIEEFNLYAQELAKAPVIANDPVIDAAFTMARVFFEKHRAFNTLSLYEQRIHKVVKDTRKELREVQAARVSRQEAQAEKEKAKMEEAIKLLNLHKTEGTPFDPQANGFVFSSAEIEREAWRRERLALAEIAFRTAHTGTNHRGGFKKAPQKATA